MPLVASYFYRSVFCRLALYAVTTFCFLGLSTLSSAIVSLQAQGLSTESAANPSQLSEAFDADDGRMSSPSLSFKSYSGSLSTYGLSVRGGQTKDTSVFVEGYRLNSPSSGDFDFSLLSPFGFDSMNLMRGPDTLLAPEASGALHLSLPRKNRYGFESQLGSESFISMGILTPVASASLERSMGDFVFEHGGKKQRRENNAAQRINIKSWKRSDRWSVMALYLQNDQGSPGSLSIPSPQAHLETFRPLVGLSYRHDSFRMIAQGHYQYQIYSNPEFHYHATNQWMVYSLAVEKLWEGSETWNSETSVRWENAKLWTRSFSIQSGPVQTPLKNHSPLRHEIVLQNRTTWTPQPGFIVQPLARLDFVSDLKSEKAFLHLGLGLRRQWTQPMALVTNLSYGSRSPNFDEMYFNDPPYAEGNSELARQKTLAFDIGTEWKWPEQVLWVPAFFIHRRDSLLQDDPTTPVFKVMNRGSSITYGLENSLKASPFQFLTLRLFYTLQQSRLGSERADYQAQHRLAGKLSLKPFQTGNLEHLEVGTTLAARSSLKAGLQTLPPSYDLGTFLSVRWRVFRFQLRAQNILSWNLMEVVDYPLPSEPTFLGSIGANF